MKRILIVDDSFSIRELIRLCLADRNVTVEEAEDGTEALALSKVNDFDLVITDVYMPKMSGTDLIKELRTLDQYSDIPIYILSSDDDPEVKKLAREIGANGWITKPINIAQINLILDETFGSDC